MFAAVLAKPAETLPEQLERISTLEQKQKEKCRLQSQIQQEKQFNRKVEINAKIRILQNAIAQLES
jgi:hypothetical protein